LFTTKTIVDCRPGGEAFLYYFSSFSCFFAKNFRMTSFAAAQRKTTAEPPVAVTFSAFRFLFPQQFFSGIGGPGGEAF
jgi:hypothetical protein